jgi:hypothetical protein
MRHRVLLFLVIVTGSVSTVASPPPVHALPCVQAIATRFVRYTTTRLKLIQHCRERVLIGRGTAPCPDYWTSRKLAKAQRTFRAAIEKHCGGADETCGVGGDDDDLATIGWNVGTCPNIAGGGCTQSIGHCGDVADCLRCSGEASVDRSIALVYDALTPTPPAYELNRCQATLGRSLLRYFDACSEALGFCELRTLLGVDVVEPCPDQLRAAPRMSAAKDKLVSRICDACGAGDDICGGDDLPPEWIGFPASCPDVTVPGGGSCAHDIRNLTDLVACVRCVADFHVGCLDAMAVPTLKPYPSECPGG